MVEVGAVDDGLREVVLEGRTFGVLITLVERY